MDEVVQPSYSISEVMEARHLLWHQGTLHWKLDVTQKQIYDFIHGNKNKVVVIAASRRIGKSYMLCTIATEICLKQPGSMIKYVAPTQSMLKDYIEPIMEEILADCPLEIKPSYLINKNVYEFPNGSKIKLAGTDKKNYDRLRGGEATLCIIDEAGFCSDLSKVINSVLIPTTLISKGKIILSSTPPESDDHEYIKYWQSAEEHNSFMKKTIFEALDDRKDCNDGRITREKVEEIIASYPERERSIEFRREYLCERIVDSNLSIIPEFISEIQQDTVVEWPRPAYYDCYVAMDIGFKDLTVALFSYYDFKHAVTVIEDEIVINGPQMTTDYLAKLIKDKEKELWSNKYTAEVKEPHLRVCDVNLIVINDLMRLHKLNFLPTSKDDKESMLNFLRMKIAARKIIINPKCKKLIAHLKNGIWKKGRGEFARNGSDGSHYDAIDALTYLIRNIDFNRNPYPKGFEFKNAGDVYYNPSFKQQDQNSEWLKLFKNYKKKGFNK